MAYGYITSTNDYKKQLKELNRNYEGRKVWDELYGQIGLSQQRAENSVRRDYLTNLSEAYTSAYNQKAAVANSALGTGYKQQAIEDLDFALSEAFDSYRQNYLTQKAQIDENALAANQAIDAELTKQAENTKLYQDSFYNYLNDLWNRAQGTGKYEDVGVDTTLQNLFTNDPLWSRYTEKIGKNTRLLDSSSLYAQLYDTNHMITDKGRDFYDQMFNSLGVVEGKDYSFHKYLSDTNSELYEWSIAANPYDYTEAGTNMGTFKTLMGLDSKDNEYAFIERYGGLSKDEIETQLLKFTKDFEDVTDSGKYKKSKNDMKIFEKATKNIRNYVNALAINQSVKDELLAEIEKYEGKVDSDVLDSTGLLHFGSNVHTAINDAKETYDDTVNPTLKVGSEWGRKIIGVGQAVRTFVKSMTSDRRNRGESKEYNEKYMETLKSDYLDLLSYIAFRASGGTK